MDAQCEQLILRVHPVALKPMGREQTLRYLAEQAAQQMPGCGAAQEIFDDAWKREQSQSTCLGMDLSVPHARVRGITHAGLYAAFNRDGLPWGDQEVRVITLLIVPWENPEVHLRLLSGITRWRRALTSDGLMDLCESADKLEASLRLAITKKTPYAA